ncbi:MAG TPA: type II toxin-antitoxin system RelE/ParE family toxin [Ginsengibacter sp.]
MDYKIIISYEAEADISEAYCYYEKEKSGLGDRLLTELDLFYRKLRHHPTYYSFVDEEKKIRSLTLKVFPYKIIYEIAAEEVYVFAIHHFSRHDDHINKRV